MTNIGSTLVGMVTGAGLNQIPIAATTCIIHDLISRTCYRFTEDVGSSSNCKGVCWGGPYFSSFHFPRSDSFIVFYVPFV